MANGQRNVGDVRRRHVRFACPLGHGCRAELLERGGRGRRCSVAGRASRERSAHTSLTSLSRAVQRAHRGRARPGPPMNDRRNAVAPAPPTFPMRPDHDQRPADRPEAPANLSRSTRPHAPTGPHRHPQHRSPPTRRYLPTPTDELLAQTHQHPTPQQAQPTNLSPDPHLQHRSPPTFRHHPTPTDDAHPPAVSRRQPPPTDEPPGRTIPRPTPQSMRANPSPRPRPTTAPVARANPSCSTRSWSSVTVVTNPSCSTRSWSSVTVASWRLAGDPIVPARHRRAPRSAQQAVRRTAEPPDARLC